MVGGIAEQQQSDASPLAALYAPVAEEMQQAENILRREMRSDYPYVDELVRYGCLLGGKRLRPALLLLAAKACGGVTEQHLTLAAVVEMVHTATLVHDDVLDEASVRRHLATVNARWDNEASVLLGDFLFSHAFYLASTLDSTLACQLIGRSTNRVCEGEIRQKGSCADFSLDEILYLEILDAKTAELCACCCQLGAHYAGASESLTRRLTMFGRHLGIAFQIADDLLDVVGSETTAGKSLGTDLEKQKPTLPLIRALEVANEAQRRDILEVLRGNPRRSSEALRTVFQRLDVLTYTRNKAQAFAQLALDQLAALPDSPAKQSLCRMAAFVVQRAF
ncbi:MAG: polyprenyl synthetase family protein [Pirellulaceae bacterium]